MLSYFGKQVENEFKRNSITLASGFKRKYSPQSDNDSPRRIRFNSGRSIPRNVIDDPLKNYYKDETDLATKKDPFDEIIISDPKRDELDDSKSNKEVPKEEDPAPQEISPDNSNSKASKSPTRGESSQAE